MTKCPKCRAETQAIMAFGVLSCFDCGTPVSAPPNPGRTLRSRLRWPRLWKSMEVRPTLSEFDGLVENLVLTEVRLADAESDRGRLIRKLLDEREARQAATSDFIALSSDETLERYISKPPDEYPDYDKGPE